MRALDPEVVDAVWAAIEPRIPVPVDNHPPGGHRPRIADRVCFMGMLTRLVTGCSWVTVERLLNYEVSDTTLRARRDEWVDDGVFDALAAVTPAAYDRIVGTDSPNSPTESSAACGATKPPDGTLAHSPLDKGASDSPASAGRTGGRVGDLLRR